MVTSAEKILVRGVNWLGDAVMTTPALQRLREANPSAHITLLSPAKLAGLWPGHPAVDDVITFRAEDTLFAVVARLRKELFSTALILPNSPRSALEAYLAGIPRRIGYARSWRSWLLTDAVLPRPEEVPMHKRTPTEVQSCIREGQKNTRLEPNPRSHHVYQYLHLARILGGIVDAPPPHIAVAAEEVLAIRTRFGFPAGSGSTRLIGVNPGAEYGPAKRWPAERFAAVAVELKKSLSCHLWLLGGPGDRTLTESIAARIQTAGGFPEGTLQNLAGQTSLREMCAALKACDVVLTNDTGPMHVAAAVGTSVVVPFGSTSPQLTGPGQPGAENLHEFLTSTAPCSPCFLRQCPIDFRCMNGIEVSTVTAAVCRALERRYR